MHLTYDLDESDLRRGTRQKVITNALSIFRIEDREGELLLKITEEQFGNALYSFIQALMKITGRFLFITRVCSFDLLRKFSRNDGGDGPGKPTHL